MKIKYSFYLLLLPFILFLTNSCADQRVPIASETLAPEIKGNTPDGKTISLSDLKGKIVLLDFWASWCGPCRKANPEIVKIYQDFKGRKFQDAKGFEIFSVSLDENKEAWQKAIEKDNLSWPYHVSDLKGWESEFAKKYGINMIPYNYVIDAQGKIIAKNLNSSQLALFLNKLTK